MLCVYHTPFGAAHHVMQFGASNQLDEVDEMTCWKTDECPVEDDSRFTKAWAVHSAERNPTTETHFDSEVRYCCMYVLCCHPSIHTRNVC